MSDLVLRYHPDAVDEVLAATRWYLDRSDKAAANFDRGLRHAENQVATSPEAWGSYLHGTRCFKLKGFPYGLVYQRRSDYILVVAVAQLHRKPGYWRERVS